MEEVLDLVEVVGLEEFLVVEARDSCGDWLRCTFVLGFAEEEGVGHLADEVVAEGESDLVVSGEVVVDGELDDLALVELDLRDEGESSYVDEELVLEVLEDVHLDVHPAVGDQLPALERPLLDLQVERLVGQGQFQHRGVVALQVQQGHLGGEVDDQDMGTVGEALSEVRDGDGLVEHEPVRGVDEVEVGARGVSLGDQVGDGFLQ